MKFISLLLEICTFLIFGLSDLFSPIYLSGNYVVPPGDDDDSEFDEDEDDELYDLSPDEDELMLEDDDSEDEEEEDELDDLEGRIEEITYIPFQVSG